MSPASSPAQIAAHARRAASLCVDNKANDVVLLDLHGVTDMADFFVVATGTSDTHVRSVAQHVVEGMTKAGLKAHHIEGSETGRWVLVDFVDFVVHVFHPTMRSYYQIERLWGDAPATAITT
ncbi:MAG: ribosome silencing factor [Gemmatimonadota bacterium]|nr:ribosome silencing factor [Gemmatimonadota bacterium]